LTEAKHPSGRWEQIMAKPPSWNGRAFRGPVGKSWHRRLSIRETPSGGFRFIPVPCAGLRASVPCGTFGGSRMHMLRTACFRSFGDGGPVSDLGSSRPRTGRSLHGLGREGTRQAHACSRQPTLRGWQERNGKAASLPGKVFGPCTGRRSFGQVRLTAILRERGWDTQ
jgi:hypothetical protein